jgi:Concanavalin A-like lectin/glucanases superfamily
VFAVLSLPLSPLAQADSSNLLPNGSFQSGTSGWKATDAAFTIASDGASDGFAGRLALNTAASSYQLVTSPRPVLNTSAGLVYTANGVVRSDTPGKSVCLLLKEFTSGGTLVLKSNDCTPAGSQWAPLPQVTLTAQNDGDSITLIVRRPSGAVSGESFEVDNLSLVASGVPPPPPPPSSVVGLWHLDELSGTTAFDSSGQGHNGAISGPVALGVPGEVNTAYSFVPKSAIIVPDAPDLRPGTANITISYWLNATTAPSTGDYDMFVKGEAGSSGGQIKLEVQPNGQASCMFRGSAGSKQLQAGPNVIDGHWHEVICQRIGNQIIETVDGETHSFTKATGSITVTMPVRLGSHENGGDWYRGVLDEVTYSIG